MHYETTVNKLGNPTARDYYFVLLFTGLRRNEAAQLKWTNIDLEAKTLTLPSKLAKNGYEHSLPLSDFLYELFSRRFEGRGDNEYVFPGYRRRGTRYYGCHQTLRWLRKESGCNFLIHDLRRCFLTHAERLDVSPYAIKMLAGHSMREDTRHNPVRVQQSERANKHVRWWRCALPGYDKQANCVSDHRLHSSCELADFDEF
jgi:integrase